MGALGRQMVMEMQLRNYSPKTIQAYTGHIAAYTRLFDKSPAELGDTEIRQYLHHLKIEKKVSSSNINIAYSGLKFFYTKVLDRSWQVDKIPRPKREKKLPVVFSHAEVEALLEAADNLKQRVILMTAYSAGLRIKETVHLKISDVDSDRMTIRVVQGKGRKDRYTLLSEILLVKLREYYLQYRPSSWLFPGKDPDKPLASESLRSIFCDAKTKAGIHKPATFHTLRHTFATHLLEAGVNLFTIKELLGHKSIHTTLIYLHIQRSHLAEVKSPLDQLWGKKS